MKSDITNTKREGRYEIMFHSR